jgi:hypothetical protein
MGGYNTAGRAWRLLIEPNSPVFGESRVNNVLEYIAMTVNAIVACRDVQGQDASPCVLALGATRRPLDGCTGHHDSVNRITLSTYVSPDI